MKGFGLSARELGYGHVVQLPAGAYSAASDAQDTDDLDTVRAGGRDQDQDQLETRSVVMDALPLVSAAEELPPLPDFSSHSLLLPATMVSMELTEPVDSATWLSEKLARIIMMVNQWQRRAVLCADLQRLVNLEFTVSETDLLYYPEDYRLSRRNALLVIASLPKALVAAAQYNPKAGLIQEEFLPPCAASVTACWHLMQGKEFAAVERALAKYFPLLLTLARQPSLYQRSAAYLAAQGSLLLGLVALHKLQFQERQAYCKQAVEYARLSEDPALLVASLIHLGGAVSDVGDTEAMLRIEKSALQHVKEIVPLLQSKLYAELAYAYAKNGQVQEALRCIGEARNTFPGETPDAPVFLSTDYGLFSLVLFEGQTFLDLGKYTEDRAKAPAFYKKSEHALAQIETAQASLIVPERFRVEIVNQQTSAALKTGDLEKFRAYLIDGITGAKALHSEKRRQEAIANWKEARKVWPGDERVRELADLILE
jgi:tetratricopeptide (TPR) repeat protein